MGKRTPAHRQRNRMVESLKIIGCLPPFSTGDSDFATIMFDILEDSFYFMSPIKFPDTDFSLLPEKKSLTSTDQKDHFHPFSTWRSLIFLDLPWFSLIFVVENVKFPLRPLFQPTPHRASARRCPLRASPRSLCGTTGSSNSWRKPMTRRWPSVAAATEAPGPGPWHDMATAGGVAGRWSVHPKIQGFYVGFWSTCRYRMVWICL